MTKTQVFHGNNLEILPTIPDNSIDSIVTDPPYELGFMGKSWDASGIAYNVTLWRECLRVLKPGGHLLAFGGTRTYHRMAVAIEDAGFEIRDSIHWIYGSGFPKSLDVSKAIDKAAGVEREIIGHGTSGKILRANGQNERPYQEGQDRITHDITAPATDEAQQWQGWGTALKPAHEPIVLARKPLEGTVANNVLTYGTGALNIDGTRIGRADGDVSHAGHRTATFGTQDTVSGGDGSGGWEQSSGRWPANLVFTHSADCSDECGGECPVAKLDQQSGQTTSGKPRAERGHGGIWADGNGIPCGPQHGDSGGASRFFYCAKPSKAERNAGLDHLDERPAGIKNSSGRGFSETDPHREIKARNFHPTVKPLALMRYLIRLVTPPGGTTLDPFAGSGTTLVAATLENTNSIGIELTTDYLPIIEGRLLWAQKQNNAYDQPRLPL